MKSLCLYDPSPNRNEYLEKVYFRSLLAHNPNLIRISSLEWTKNATVLVNGDYLHPCVIRRLKEEKNTIIAFDINDNSLLSDTYRHAPELSQVDLIFKIGGVQKINHSFDLSIDGDFNFNLQPRSFLPDDLWIAYKALSDASRLQSLPYVPWGHKDAPERSYVQRSGKVLVRGGNHFYRFMVFLNLLKIGRLDEGSSFATADYYREDMNSQFRYCHTCRLMRRDLPDSGFQEMPYRPEGCASIATWGGEKVEGLDRYETANHWNNRCPASFMWLTQQFEKKHGPVDHQLTERCLNGTYESAEKFTEALSNATFYTDLKWLFSIYCPPRFWEAANAGTLNYLPRRTNEQNHFPHIEDGVHYLTFGEDFVGFNPYVGEKAFTEITENAREAYTGWVQPGVHPISERLCRHIFSQIERFAS